MGFPTLASIQVTYEFLASGRGKALVSQLEHLTRHAYAKLVSLCARYHSMPLGLLRIHQQPPQTPIMPLFTTQPHNLARHCQKSGLMIRPVVAPTVPVGTDRVRLCLHAHNTIHEIDRLVTAVEEWVSLQLAGNKSAVEGLSKL